MAGWVKVRQHVWPDAEGTPVLRHTKYLTPEGEARFPWEHRVVFGETGIARWFTGDGKGQVPHPLLYRRDLLAMGDRGADLLVCEGEADVDAAHERGLLAVTAGAAGALGLEHAHLLRGWRGRITVVRDNDLPGAWGAAKAYAALRAVGIPASRLRVARGRVRAEGADLRDHLDAGHPADRLVAEPIASVRRLAARATAESFSRAGYGDWVVVSAEEAAQLVGWKPVGS